MSSVPGQEGSPPRQPCPHCQHLYTSRSLDEHLEKSHLGVKCYFPGSSLVLAEEDDHAMLQELLRCNMMSGGGYRDNEFWCHWPNCNPYNFPHSYKYDGGLKRHLRMKQKKIHLYNLSIVQPAGPPAVPTSAAAQVPVLVPAQVPVPVQAPVPAQVPAPLAMPAPTPSLVPVPVFAPPANSPPDQAVIDEAVLQVRLAMARRDAKYECFRSMIMTEDPNETLTPDQRMKFRMEIQEVNDAVDEALRRIFDIVGYGPNGSLEELWDTYSGLIYSVQLFMKFWLNHFTVVDDQVQEWNKYCVQHIEFQLAVDKILEGVKKIPCQQAQQPVKIEESGVKIEQPN
ncbi:hypothetical protein F5Y00DRAFT_273249 [Daldinia vernicosa]|uniref:uncharacterized protein n=1 Tax=Daldinia vernicosa TaxID=114800 RepID=UPI0020087690|nr:uncharacterized protein F5Y00DRAFT_273249 [Daldinia vernicosa]KAI0845190.1 hypothetical protein F5Y00DRAFT_273249 [Daldinia vernicosa]